MFKVTVFVTLKESVLDPQGNAVKDALHSLNFDEVKDVRIGKYMELQIDAPSDKEARERAVEMCEKLLANIVIEDYRLEIVGVNNAAESTGFADKQPTSIASEGK